MKRKINKNCSSFKSISVPDAMHNHYLTTNCSNCVYFSSKNCHLDAQNEIEENLEFL